MLVLSRKKGEAVEFAELDVVVRVISLAKSKVQLGIEAPREITIHRSEIAPEQHSSPAADGTAESFLATVLNELSTVEARLAALSEFADANGSRCAGEIAADSMERLGRVKRALGRSHRQQSKARPIADFIKVRADVIDQLRSTPDNVNADSQSSEEPICQGTIRWPGTSHDRSSCAREKQLGYAINSSTLPTKFSVA